MVEHKDRAHAKLGGSQAHRWMNCYGSVALISTIPALEASEAAKRGTHVHEACERCLREFLNFKITGNHTDEAWSSNYEEIVVDTAIGYTETVWKEVLQQSLTGKAWGIEEEVCLDEKLEMWGIVDFWCIYIDDRGRRVLAIVDFKNGYHYVDEKKNSQFIFYAASMLSEIRAAGKDLDFIRTCVYQPNISHGAAFREARYTIKQMDTWTKKFFKAAREILQGSTKLKVGDWCQFCPAKAVCKMHGADISNKAALALLDPANVVLPNIETIEDSKLARIVLYASQIEDFISAVKLYAINRHRAGNPLPGLKLIQGPTRRTWIDDESAVAKALADKGIDPYQRKLITITSAEKQLGKDVIRPIVTTTKPSIVLVPVKDPRPAIENALDKLGE